ncbi:MAG: hypothetical protein ABL866_15105 [Devosia sp.]
MTRIICLAMATALITLSLAGAVLAKSVPLYPQKIDLYFVDAKGKIRTVTFTMNIDKAGLGNCTGVDEIVARTVVLEKQPSLYTMPYIGSTCQGEKPLKATDARPQTADDRPAMVVLFFIDSDGVFHYSSFGRQGTSEYRMDTCPLIVKQTEATLLKQVQADHVGQEFRGASCFLRSANRTQFTNK